VLIDANRDYYSFEIVPEFWDWLIYMGNSNSVKIPIEIYEELKRGKKDDLTDWIKEKDTHDALLFTEEARVDLVWQVTSKGYAADLTDIEIGLIGRDPFLISYGLAHPKERCIVTTEISKPKRKRANRHIPDVCHQFGIQRCNTFEFVRALNFNTNWKTKVDKERKDDLNS